MQKGSRVLTLFKKCQKSLGIADDSSRIHEICYILCPIFFINGAVKGLLFHIAYNATANHVKLKIYFCM